MRLTTEGRDILHAAFDSTSFRMEREILSGELLRIERNVNFPYYISTFTIPAEPGAPKRKASKITMFGAPGDVYASYANGIEGWIHSLG